MPYFDLTTRDDTATPKATAVHDKHRPGVRLNLGPLYVSMTVPEVVNVLEVLIAALAEVDPERRGD